jgi:hypothetical protein
VELDGLLYLSSCHSRMLKFNVYNDICVIFQLIVETDRLFIRNFDNK